MVTSLELTRDGFLGFFELDNDGIVRYSRTGTSVDEVEANVLVGQDYFESVGFRNSDELRKLFKRFVDSREAADSFPFDCFFDGSVVHTKVTLTRAFETEIFPPESIVMLSIRETGN